MKQNQDANIPIKYIAPLFIALGLLVYSAALYGPFILDDADNIVNNMKIRDLSSFADLAGARYVTYLSFALNYAISGLDTFGYHISNVFIHVINAILVYLMVSLLAGTPLLTSARAESDGQALSSTASLALAASLLFLLHPLQTQAVAYITQRFASLATLFYLLSLVLYLKSRLISFGGERAAHARQARFYYITALISAVVAMRTKEIAFTLPFIVMLFEFVFMVPSKTAKSPGSAKPASRWLALIPFLLTLFIIPLFLYGPSLMAGGESSVQSVMNEAQLRDLDKVPRYNYFITQFGVILVYIKLFFIPEGLHLLYDYPPARSLADARVFLPGLVLLFIFGVAIWLFIRSAARRSYYGILASLGIVWFFITMSVESSVIPIQHPIFEHRSYLPSVGFFIFISAAIHYISSRFKGLMRGRVMWALLVAVLLLLGLLTYQRNLQWGDRVLFYENEVAESPNVAGRHIDLANSYMMAGRSSEAVASLREALRLKPDSVKALTNLGVISMRGGNYLDAIRLFGAALEIDPAYEDARYNIGTALLNTGKNREAIRHFKLALESEYAKESVMDRVHTSNVHVNIANAYVLTGKYLLAREEYLKALRLHPGNELAAKNLEHVKRRLSGSGLKRP